MKRLFEKFNKLLKEQTMATITVNGVSIIGSKSISISGGKVIVDGVDRTPESKNITVSVQGDIEVLSVDVANQVTINGNAGQVSSVSGDIDVNGDVSGDVKSTSGDIDCGNVGGNVETMSGDVDAATINGNVKTLSGDINT